LIGYACNEDLRQRKERRPESRERNTIERKPVVPNRKTQEPQKQAQRLRIQRGRKGAKLQEGRGKEVKNKGPDDGDARFPWPKKSKDEKRP